MFKNLPAFTAPILFCIAPFLFFMAQHPGLALPASIFYLMAASVTVAIVLIIAGRLVLGTWLKSAFLTTMFAILFFTYGHLRNIFIAGFGNTLSIGPYSLGSDHALAYGLITSVLGLMYFTARKQIRIEKIMRILTFAAIILITISLCRIVPGVISRNKTGRILPAAAGSPVEIEKTNMPDIYYLVVDAYAGAPILKELYNYDNDPFLGFLHDKGFFVATGAHSNYCQTSLSLASSLNCSYLDALIDLAPLEQLSDPMIAAHLIKKNAVFKFLRARGYKIAAYGSGRPETELPGADIYISNNNSLDSIFSDFINTTAILACFSLVGHDPRFDTHRQRLLSILDGLGTLPRHRTPLFIFAHIELPHPPFVFGSQGEALSPAGPYNDFDANWLIKRGGISREQYIKRYRDQLHFTNTKLRSAIERILSAPGKRPVIILQSDHGPRLALKWENPARSRLDECFSILNAYYCPDGNYNDLSDDATPVNSFRAIFNTYFAAGMPMLANRYYYSSGITPYKFIRLTENFCVTEAAKK